MREIRIPKMNLYRIELSFITERGTKMSYTKEVLSSKKKWAIEEAKEYCIDKHTRRNAMIKKFIKIKVEKIKVDDDATNN